MGKLILYVNGNSGSKFSSNSKSYTGYGIHSYIGKFNGKSVGILSKYLTTTHGYKIKSVIANDKLKKVELRNSNSFPSDNNLTIDNLELYKVYDIYGYDKSCKNSREIELRGFIKALELIPTLITNNEDEVIITEVMLVLESIYVLSYAKKILVDVLDIDKINENKDLIKELKDVLLLVNKKYKINLSKVLTNNKDIGNEKAKILSNLGLNLSSKNIDINDDIKILVNDKTYWKDVKINLDKFYFKQLFNFYPDTTLDSKLYYGINYKDLADFGKKMTNITYTLIKLENGDEYIDFILKNMRELLGSLHVPYVLLLDAITNKNILRNYKLYGNDYIMSVDGRNTKIIRTMDDVVLAETLYPTGLSNIIMNNFLELVKSFNSIRNNDSADTIIDITDLIYDNVNDKNVIKKEFINDKYILKVPFRVDGYRLTTIRVRSNLDLPNRNKLKRYEKLNPKVKLIITQYKNILMYKTMIVLEDKDYIVSNNIYANKIILKQK